MPQMSKGCPHDHNIQQECCIKSKSTSIPRTSQLGSVARRVIYGNLVNLPLNPERLVPLNPRFKTINHLLHQRNKAKDNFKRPFCLNALGSKPKKLPKIGFFGCW
uniref:Uncharacterized protein n=1 Tax=Opuntia streptacantha TaxID=393608 RepID=A0A7C9AU84_OPUST